MPDTLKEVQLRTKGILPVQKLRLLHELGIISSHENYPIQDDQFQPNSIDLRLGEIAYRVRCSFLPENETVQEKIERLKMYEVPITEGAVLEENCVYIIPLLESLNLPNSNNTIQKGLFNGEKELSEVKLGSIESLTAKANPKSSTGRLDVFTRVITDYSHRFEEVTSGYQGRLYLEVVPKSFSIKVKTGQRLNQLRVRHGFEVISDQDLLRVHSSDPLLFDEDLKPVSMEKIKVKQGLFMSVNLKGEEGEVIGYKAKKHNNFIDLDKIGHYAVNEFWEPIYAQPNDQHFLGWEIKTLEPSFDPETFTIMDFDNDFSPGVGFMYVLPYSHEKALFEFTVFSENTLKKKEYKEQIRSYLYHQYGLDKEHYEITRKEYGVIPMEDRPHVPYYDQNVINLGSVGGQTKPSTGYTFTRIQDYTQKLAQNLIQGFDPLPPQPSKFKYRYYDLLLLHILSNSTDESLRVFRSLYKKNSLDEIFRFLGEDTSFLQDLKIMSSVPYTPFFKAIGHNLKG